MEIPNSENMTTDELEALRETLTTIAREARAKLIEYPYLLTYQWNNETPETHIVKAINEPDARLQFRRLQNPRGSELRLLKVELWHGEEVS